MLHVLVRITRVLVGTCENFCGVFKNQFDAFDHAEQLLEHPDQQIYVLPSPEIPWELDSDQYVIFPVRVGEYTVISHTPGVKSPRRQEGMN